MTLEAFIFDIGGVLAEDVWEHLFLDPDRGISARFSLDRLEVERVGSMLWHSFAYLPETKENNWKQLEQLYWESFITYFRGDLPPKISTTDFIELTDDFIRPIKGMRPILEKLKSDRLGLAICSNNNEFWFKRQMTKLKLGRFFKPAKVVLSCRVGFSKSSPGLEMFKATVNAVAVPKHKCLLIDDRADNVERAREFGIQSLLFRNAIELANALNRINT